MAVLTPTRAPVLPGGAVGSAGGESHPAWLPTHRSSAVGSQVFEKNPVFDSPKEKVIKPAQKEGNQQKKKERGLTQNGDISQSLGPTASSRTPTRSPPTRAYPTRSSARPFLLSTERCGWTLGDGRV